MVLSTIRMAIPVEKQNDALKTIRSIGLQTRDVPGCISYSIYKDLEDNNVLMLQTKWDNDSSLTLHIRSNIYRNLLLVLEMSFQQPEIIFDTISGSTGIETIEKIRSSNDCL